MANYNFKSTLYVLTRNHDSIFDLSLLSVSEVQLKFNGITLNMDDRTSARCFNNGPWRKSEIDALYQQHIAPFLKALSDKNVALVKKLFPAAWRTSRKIWQHPRQQWQKIVLETLDLPLLTLLTPTLWLPTEKTNLDNDIPKHRYFQALANLVIPKEANLPQITLNRTKALHQIIQARRDLLKGFVVKYPTMALGLIRDHRDSTTLLHLAVRENSLPMIQALIALGARINARDSGWRNTLERSQISHS